MQVISNRLTTLVGTALILAFFSEFYFMNEGPVQDVITGNIAATLELVAFYILFAYAFLICITVFRVRSWAGLILAGGIYGLSAEAVVVPVVYEAFPVSLIWTSLSWHTLVDVAFGWGILRLALRARNGIWAGLWFALLGVLWAMWATWFWGAEGIALTLGEFSVYSVVTSLGLTLGLFLTDRAPMSLFQVHRVEIIAVVAITLLLFAVTGLPFLPLPGAILVVVLIILGALGLERRWPTMGSILTGLETPPAPIRYLTIALLPAAASASYAVVLDTGFQIATEDVAALMLTLGAVSFLWALTAPLWRRAMGARKS